jgi:hypothetical protein
MVAITELVLGGKEFEGRIAGCTHPFGSWFALSQIRIEVNQVTSRCIVETEKLEMPLLRFARIVTTTTMPPFPGDTLFIYIRLLSKVPGTHKLIGKYSH